MTDDMRAYGRINTESVDRRKGMHRRPGNAIGTIDAL